ncbi:MAG: hypothetical protein NT128_07970 [Proteobacteria bacterium]|nr:hypothetical protein [Pseudomonadota bacterium]
MKIQLKLMILTLALFSFANAAHLVDHVTPMIDQRPAPVIKPVVSCQDPEVASVETDRQNLCRVVKDLRTLGTDLWDFGVRGAAREIKNRVLHEENLAKAAKLYNTGKNKAFEMYSKVTRTVPCWLFWGSVALATDAVTTEFVIESFPVAAGIGVLSCYGASYLSPFISQKPAAMNPKARQCQEELARLMALREDLLSKQRDGAFEDEDDAARKAVSGLVVEKAKD